MNHLLARILGGELVSDSAALRRDCEAFLVEQLGPKDLARYTTIKIIDDREILAIAAVGDSYGHNRLKAVERCRHDGVLAQIALTAALPERLAAVQHISSHEVRLRIYRETPLGFAFQRLMIPVFGENADGIPAADRTLAEILARVDVDDSIHSGLDVRFSESADEIVRRLDGRAFTVGPLAGHHRTSDVQEKDVHRSYLNGVSHAQVRADAINDLRTSTLAHTTHWTMALQSGSFRATLSGAWTVSHHAGDLCGWCDPAVPFDYRSISFDTWDYRRAVRLPIDLSGRAFESSPTLLPDHHTLSCSSAINVPREVYDTVDGRTVLIQLLSLLESAAASPPGGQLQ